MKRPFDSGLQRGAIDVVEKWLGFRPDTKPDGSPTWTPPPLEKLYAVLKANVTGERDPLRSIENWRLTVEDRLSERNTSDEKCLEKCLARALEADGWSNQVPTCSGYSDGRDGKRAIDWVQDLGDDRFKFYELKTRSNTPHYAGVEVLLYGLTYLLARELWRSSPKPPPRLLRARSVALSVIAPRSFYERYPRSSLSAFAVTVDEALRTFVESRHADVAMSFQFDVLGPGFAAGRQMYALEELRAMIQGTKPLGAEDCG